MPPAGPRASLALEGMPQGPLLQQAIHHPLEQALGSAGHHRERHAMPAADRAQPQVLTALAPDQMHATAAEDAVALGAFHAGREGRMDRTHWHLISRGRFRCLPPLHPHVSQAQDLALVQLHRLGPHGCVVHKRAIGRVQVADPHALGPHFDLAVETGNGGIEDHKVVCGGPSKPGHPFLQGQDFVPAVRSFHHQFGHVRTVGPDA